MFLRLSVILFMGGGCNPACNGHGGLYPNMQYGKGGCLPLGLGGGYLPPGLGDVHLPVIPRADSPPPPPPEMTIETAVRILLECILVLINRSSQPFRTVL